MSIASSVVIASILVAAFCATNASATSLFEKGGAQDIKNVSDGYFAVNGRLHDNGAESFDITALPHQLFASLGDNDAENSEGTRLTLGSNSFAANSLASAIAESAISNGVGGFSSSGGNSSSSGGNSSSSGGNPSNFGSLGNGSRLTNSGIAAPIMNAADGPVGDPVAAPLPGALPLLATALGALGLLGWRRKRKAQAAA
jgi:hypothetical protein